MLIDFYVFSWLLNDFYDLEIKGGVDLNVMPEGYGPGIEDSCKYVYDYVNPMIQQKTNNRVWIDKVSVYEHVNNWAEYVGL